MVQYKTRAVHRKLHYYRVVTALRPSPATTTLESPQEIIIKQTLAQISGKETNITSVSSASYVIICTMNQYQRDNDQLDITQGEVQTIDVGNEIGQSEFRMGRSSCRQDLFKASQNDCRKSCHEQNFIDPSSVSIYDPTGSHRKRTAPPTTSSGDSNRTILSSKMRLMVFIKIILKCLETDDPGVRLEAKRVIAECTKKNREGHPDYIPLEDAITRGLRFAVDEVHWRRAETLMNHYIKMHTQGQSPCKSLKSDMSRFAEV